MKTIHLFNGPEINVEDEKAKIIEEKFMSGERVGFKVNGFTFTTSSINYIEEAPKIPTWGGYKCKKDKDGNYYFMRDGHRCVLEDHNIAEIKWLEQTDSKLLN